MDDHVHDSGDEKPIVPLHHGPLPLTMISVYGEGMLGLKLLYLNAKKLSHWLPVGGYRLVASRLRFAALNRSKEWTMEVRSL
jgi:hypothetical protein